MGKRNKRSAQCWEVAWGKGRNNENNLTKLMRKLFTHDGDGRATASEHWHSEGGANGQTVDEIVHGITQCNHPCHCLDPGQPPSTEPVAHHCRRVLVLQKSTDTHTRQNKKTKMFTWVFCQPRGFFRLCHHRRTEEASWRRGHTSSRLHFLNCLHH